MLLEKRAKIRANQGRIIFFAWLVLILTVNIAISNKTLAPKDTAAHEVTTTPDTLLLSAPSMILIPKTNLYFAVEGSLNRFFHFGYWYTIHKRSWYRATYYNGPWFPVLSSMVPQPLLDLPENYRELYAKNERIPYTELKKHWKQQARVISSQK
ncbi:MAG: hypothetical protein LLF86_04340 [Nitrospiraceae bacterium]|nr:hypothetical protein [Nitrospiraceae bacterium]